jgi:hypothetical protein
LAAGTAIGPYSRESAADRESDSENSIPSGRTYLRIYRYRIVYDLFAFLGQSHLAGKLACIFGSAAFEAKGLRYNALIRNGEAQCSSSIVLTIDNGISPDMVHCVTLVNHETSFTNDDADFSFIIEALSELLVRIDLIPRCNDAAAPLREYYRMRC